MHAVALRTVTINQVAFSLPVKSNLAIFKGVWQWNYCLLLSGEKHLATVFATSWKIGWVNSKPCIGKTLSRTRKLPQKGHTFRPSAKMQCISRTENTCRNLYSCVTEERSLTLTYRNLVTLGPSSAETVSRTKKSFRSGHTDGPSSNGRKA